MTEKTSTTCWVASESHAFTQLLKQNWMLSTHASSMKPKSTDLDVTFDIVIYVKTFEDLCTEFREACRLRQYQTYINVRKCQFGYQRFKYLGFIVEDSHIMPEPKEAAKFKAIPAPRDIPSLG
eukprot:Blabericola_migrator_1__1225@NODE_1314_length_4836_cov_33_074858_g884_i0_p4_GENE_NODE_1314_length_4836_cov_33_074858_g884_i0NODE_1314_length_4836_cov_33_074858_g884_i0_p4_ORF_typecomplete_len123_score16_27_NODE_1314_length_4836_cov_33_074858_g884_i0605973